MAKRSIILRSECVKRVKGDHDPSVKEHLLFCNHATDFEEFSIIATNNNAFEVTLMESLLINRDHPLMNMELFDG